MKRKVYAILCVFVFIVLGTLLVYGSIAYKKLGLYPDKIWLHRCNSIEKWMEKQDMYPNVEVDVIFRDIVGKFDVTHDEEVSFGLNIDAYFAYMEKNKGKIWLDVKNLNENNKEAMLAELNRLTEMFHVDKKRLIIESRAWKDLGFFTKNGYYTSFYVYFERPDKLSSEERRLCIEQLQDIADSGCVCALSFPGHWYCDIKRSLDSTVDLLTWKHRCTQWEVLLTLEGKRMLKDAQLKVILVKDKGRYHR